MAAQSRKGRQILLESLERRETPSTAAGGVHALAARRASVDFHGGGTGTVLSATTTTLAGKASQLGTFTGTLTSTGTSTATAVLVASNGSNLDLNVTGSYNRSITPLSNGSFPIYFGTFRFQVTGGTSALAQAAGSGVLNARVNSTDNSLTFHFRGRLTHPPA